MRTRIRIARGGAPWWRARMLVNTPVNRNKTERYSLHVWNRAEFITGNRRSKSKQNLMRGVWCQKNWGMGDSKVPVKAGRLFTCTSWNTPSCIRVPGFSCAETQQSSDDVMGLRFRPGLRRNRWIGNHSPMRMWRRYRLTGNNQTSIRWPHGKQTARTLVEAPVAVGGWMRRMDLEWRTRRGRLATVIDG